MTSTEHDDFDLSDLIDKMDEAADQRETNDGRKVASDLIVEFRQLTRNLPLHVLEGFLQHLRGARQTGVQQSDPLVGLQALVGGMGASQPAALPIGKPEMQASAPDSGSQPEAEDEAIIYTVRGQTADRKNQVRRILQYLLQLSGDRLLGALQAMDDIVDGVLKVDRDGRPIEIGAAVNKQHDLERDIDSKDADLTARGQAITGLQRDLAAKTQKATDLEGQLRQARQELVDAKAAPAPASVDPALLTAVRTAVQETYRNFNWRAPADRELNDPNRLIQLLKALPGSVHADLTHRSDTLDATAQARDTANTKLTAVKADFADLDALIQRLKGDRWSDETAKVSEAKSKARKVADALK